MEVLTCVHAFLLHWILGPFWWIVKTVTEIRKLHKVYTTIKSVVKWVIMRLSKKQGHPHKEEEVHGTDEQDLGDREQEHGKEEKQEEQLPQTQVPRKKTYVRTVGKDTVDFTPRVSATGLRADNGSDVREALRNVDTLETIGLQRGSAETVEATGIDLRKRQRRSGESTSRKDIQMSGRETSLRVTGLKEGTADTVIATGIRY